VVDRQGARGSLHDTSGWCKNYGVLSCEPMRRTLIVLIVALVAAPLATAVPKKKKKGNDEPLALIAGTVFQSSGFSFPGVTVYAVSRQDPKIGVEATTGRRGEFALRVPAKSGPYLVTAEAKGFETQQKTADVYEGDKTTVTFQLKTAKDK